MKLCVLLTTVVLSADARLSVREIAEPKEPADSKTIDGPDCGHVKQIIGQWAKAKKAGTLAGIARGTVDNGARAEDYILDTMLPRAEDIGEEIGTDGKIPEGIDKSLKAAKERVKDVTKLTTALDTTLSNFKDKVSDSEFSAKKVSAEDMTKLKDEIDAANEGIKNAYEAGEQAIERANNAKSNALKDASKATKILKSIAKTAFTTLDEAKSVAQKSRHVMDEATETVDKASKVKDKVKKKGSDAGDQEPVYDALASNLDDRSTSVTDGSKSLEQAINDMKTLTDKLNENADSLKQASEEGDAGETQSVLSEVQNVPKVEGQVDETKVFIGTIKSRAKTLIERTERLKDLMKNAEKKTA